MQKSVHFPTVEEKEEARVGWKRTPAKLGGTDGVWLMALLSHYILALSSMERATLIGNVITLSTYR
jgi:hypothetical protein